LELVCASNISVKVVGVAHGADVKAVRVGKIAKIAQSVK
jgi:hypothetical protein